MTSVLITGSNRGIGLGLVKYFLNHADPPKILIAACRNPDSATELQELKKKNNNLHLLQLDVTKYDTFPEVVKNVESIVGPNGLNVLINNAGTALANKFAPFDELKPEDYVNLYHINTIGPIFLTRALLPLMEKAANANKDKPEGIKRAAIFNMSSLLGSVSLNFGSYHAYRESKAALNQFSRSLALIVEGKGITVTVLHPGHVRTDLGGPDGKLSLDESVSDITQYDTFPDFAKKVESIVGASGLNVLINNAAITVDNNNHLDNVKPDDFIRAYKNNVVGPIFLTKALLPLIERAADVNKDKPQGIQRAAIFNMSSLGGSVSLNSRMGGSCYCYRESKAALNQFSRTLALVVEDKGILLVVLHPGHVQTDMGGPTARITVDESVSGLIKVIYSADKNMHNKFVMWNGGELTW